MESPAVSYRCTGRYEIKPLADESILYMTDDPQKVYVLNDVGSAIYAAFSAARTETELVDLLFAEFDVDLETLKADTRSFLEALLSIDAICLIGSEP